MNTAREKFRMGHLARFAEEIDTRFAPEPPPLRAAVALRGVRKSFGSKGQVHETLRGVDLTLQRGEIHGILGASGAGKTTLLRCLLQLETVDAGEIVIDGVDWTKLTQSELRAQRRRVGVVFQHLHLVASRTTAENIALPLELAGVPKQQRQERVRELLEWFGIREKADEYPARLSGGQRQRVALARALATRPSLLLADEPTSALDLQTKQSVINTLKRVRDELDVTVLLITHDLAAAESLCDSLSLLEGGRIVESGPSSRLLSNTQSELCRRLLNADGTSATGEELRPRPLQAYVADEVWR